MSYAMKRPRPTLTALALLAFGLSSQMTPLPDGSPVQRGRMIHLPVRVFDPAGKPYKKASVFFIRQALSAQRVVHDDRYGYQLFRFDPDSRGRFHVRLPPGGNWSAYAFAEEGGKRLASRLQNQVYAGRPLKLHLLEDKRKTLVIKGLSPWRKLVGRELALEVSANSSVSGLIPGPSSPHFRIPLQKGSVPGALPDRFEVALPSLPKESLWVALVDAKGGFLESLFLGRGSKPLGNISFGTPVLRAFRLRDKAGKPLPGARVLVRSGTPIVSAERLLRTDASGVVQIPYGRGKKGASLLRDEINPVALFLPGGCSVLYREVNPQERTRKKKAKILPSGPSDTGGEVMVTASKVKGFGGFVFDPGTLNKGVRYVQLVGAVSKTGFVRDLIVPLPEGVEPDQVIQLPYSGDGRRVWNGLLRLEGGQASPAGVQKKAGIHHVQAPGVSCVLTLFRPGKERAFGGRIALEVKEEDTYFMIPFSADSHGKVYLRLPRAEYRLLAFEPRVGEHEEVLDLTKAPAHMEKEITLTPFYELLVHVQTADGKPVSGAKCRWGASQGFGVVPGGGLKYRVLGQRVRGRVRSDDHGVVRLYFYSDVGEILLIVPANLGGKRVVKQASILTMDGVHELKMVLK